jgi:hypothetical protein
MKISRREVPNLRSHDFDLFSLAYVNQSEFRLGHIFSKVSGFFQWANIKEKYKN